MDLWQWWLDHQDDFDDHVGDRTFEDKVRGAYAQYRTENPDEIAVLDGGATFALLRNIANPFPGTSMVEAGRLLVQSEHRARLGQAYADAAAAASRVVVAAGGDDPHATVRLSGLMLGLTADEMGAC